MECAGWLLDRYSALEVQRTLWALPTTVSPVLPSLRDSLSNRRISPLLPCADSLALCRWRYWNIVRAELAVMRKQRPHRAYVLVRQRDRCDVRMAPLKQACQPRIDLGLALRGEDR